MSYHNDPKFPDRAKSAAPDQTSHPLLMDEQSDQGLQFLPYHLEKLHHGIISSFFPLHVPSFIHLFQQHYNLSLSYQKSQTIFLLLPDVPTTDGVPPLTPGTTQKMSQALLESFKSFEKEQQHQSIPKGMHLSLYAQRH